MPRHADPVVEERVIHAARKLWARGGYNALSMRALAKAARTNTPAIYRRFRNKKDLLRAIVRRAQQDLFVVLEPCTFVPGSRGAYPCVCFGKTRTTTSSCPSGLFSKSAVRGPTWSS